RLQELHLIAGKNTRVCVRQKTTVDGHLASSRDILRGRAMAKLRERIPIRRERGFGPVAETHQGFFAALGTTAGENIIDIRRRHCPCIRVCWILSESAITAAIATKIRNREENFSRIGNSSAFEFVA